MPYLPDLIPKDQKVIPEYFHKQSAGGLKAKQKTSAAQVLLGLLFFFIAVYFILYTG